MRALRTVPLLVVLAARSLAAQSPPAARAVELVASGALVAGLTPLVLPDRRTTARHLGGRVDGAVQGRSLAAGAGLRFWNARADADIEASGIDLFLHAEWRATRASRTSVRAGTALPFARIYPSTAGGAATGLSWWAGIAHEVPMPWGRRVLLTADMIVPVSASTPGRRAPILEIGVGARTRFFKAIRLPVAR